MVVKMDKKTINWEKQINQLIRYAGKLEYDVEILKTPGKVSYVNLKTKQIRIFSGHSNERKFYLLLHEIGHVILFDKNRTYKNGVAYGQYNFSRNSTTYKINFLEEEIEAWKKGRELARRMKLKVTKRNFEKIKSISLASYIKLLFKEKNEKEDFEDL